MKHTLPLLTALLAATSAQAAETKLLDDKPAAGRLDVASTLWYQQPATRFYQSLPLGNGRIGAMVFGGVDEERIILNESSLWSCCSRRLLPSTPPPLLSRGPTSSSSSPTTSAGET